MDHDSVWRALTSPHRRTILDHLRDGPKTTGQLSKSLNGLSRFAVMQHLGVLEEARLVLVKRSGRARLNFLNPVPLRDVYERWVSGMVSAAAETAQHLKRFAELDQEKNMEESFRVVRIELESEIAASPERVFDALTKDIDAWWPHRISPEGKVSHDCRVGGNIAESWNGGGALYGSILLFEPSKRIVSVASGFMGCCTIRNEESVEAHGDGCRYLKSLQLWGIVPETMERTFREGSAAIVDQALKAYCEEGKTYGAH